MIYTHTNTHTHTHTHTHTLPISYHIIITNIALCEFEFHCACQTDTSDFHWARVIVNDDSVVSESLFHYSNNFHEQTKKKMPGSHCAIVGCTADSVKCRGLSFFSVRQRKPPNPKWELDLVHAVNRTDQSFNIERARICSRHFKPEFIQTSGNCLFLSNIFLI